MRPFGPLVPWTTAVRRLERSVEPVSRDEEVEVGHAVGRVASRAYRSPCDVPPFDRATWDGYAVRARSTRGATPAEPRRLGLVGEVFAEGGFSSTVHPGEAVAIATGGAMPLGTDGVIPFEEVTLDGSALLVPRPVRVGERVARAGEDLRRGAMLVRAGDVLSPAGVGALAITGHPAVSVWALPHVTIIPNGSELAGAGATLRRGQIYESNGATLSAVIEASGGRASSVAPVPDDPDRIEAAIRRALVDSDLVLVTGGSSVGERDFLPTIFPRLGRVLFHGIAIRPGKPTLAVEVGHRVVIGMPGHPASCLSNAYWLVVPILRRLARLPGPAWVPQAVRLAQSVDLPRSTFATVVPLEVRGAAARPTFHDSSAITSLGGANAFAIWPAGRPAPRRGSRLTAHVLLPPLGSVPGSFGRN
jgi:molybdenum cofactor synthesis domain-containing protein